MAPVLCARGSPGRAEALRIRRGGGVKKKQLHCLACTRRIKDHHPHVGLINLEPGREIPYHARYQKRAAVDLAAMAEQGKAYVMRHYHSATPGWDCAGGCFNAPVAVAN